MLFKEKEKLLDEIQKRAHQLKKQQEAQSAIKVKIKVINSGIGSLSFEHLVKVILYILCLRDKTACAGRLWPHPVKDLLMCLFLKDDGKQITGWREEYYRQNF